jgi:hypothetical protein
MKVKLTARFRAKLLSLENPDHAAPTPNPLDLNLVYRWLGDELAYFQERPNSTSGGPPQKKWLRQACGMLSATYEYIYEPTRASYALGGPTSKFLRSFLKEGGSAINAWQLKELKQGDGGQGARVRSDSLRSYARIHFYEPEYEALRKQLRRALHPSEIALSGASEREVDKCRRIIETMFSLK